MHDEALRGSTRRRLIGGATAALTMSVMPPLAAQDRKIAAIAFDAFPIFDVRRFAMLAKTSFPEKGEMLASQWLNKLFGYTWLVTSAGRYQSFEALADSSLRVTAGNLGLTLSDEARSALISGFSQLEIWPDVKPALSRLKAAGLRLAFLSNLGEAALRSNMRNAGIEEAFEAVLSTDRVRAFKPAPVAYQMAIEAFGLPKERIGFAAFGGWDAIGATWFGYRTAWINRTGAPAEMLDAKPEIVSPGIEGVLALAGLS